MLGHLTTVAVSMSQKNTKEDTSTSAPEMLLTRLMSNPLSSDLITSVGKERSLLLSAVLQLLSRCVQISWATLRHAILLSRSLLALELATEEFTSMT